MSENKEVHYHEYAGRGDDALCGLSPWPASDKELGPRMTMQASHVTCPECVAALRRKGVEDAGSARG